jgi:predicted PhzF superfamily epimerase YddE/YHI9
MKVTVFHVDSFCINGTGGNPAGVVLGADVCLANRENILLRVSDF